MQKRYQLHCQPKPNPSPVLGSGRTRLANPAGNPEAPAARATGKQRAFGSPSPSPSRNSRLTPLKSSCNLDSAACGLVVQLGRVEPRYQLALETAAGLGQLVVEDDAVAAAGIELLKQKRAGRATFLPLNKIKPHNTSQQLLYAMQMDLLTMPLT